MSNQQHAQPGCSPRLTFWIAAGSSWLVWMFAVAAGADDKWLSDEDSEEFLAAGEDLRLDFCNDLEDSSVYDESCAMFKAFTAMQVMATIACSFSVLLLSLAFFQPAAGGCSSARSLAWVGGALMATYALFQLIAVVLAGTIKEELDSLVEDTTFGDDTAEYDLGPTFGVGVTGLILGVIFSILILLFARHTGDGPLYSCCHSLMLANKANGSPATGDGAAAGKPAAAIGEPLPGSKPMLPTAVPQQQGAASPPPYDEVPSATV